MRIFVGVVPPSELSLRVARAAKELATLSKGELHVPRSEPHITLKAPQHVDSADKVVERVKEVAARTKPFEITTRGTAFTRGIYLALQISSSELQRLHESLVRALGEFNTEGIVRAEGKNFNAHLSIAKANKPVNDEEPYLDVARKSFPEDITVPINRLTVFELNDEANTFSHQTEIPLGG